MSVIPSSSMRAQQLYDLASTPSAVGAWECSLPSETLRWTDGVYDLFGLPRGHKLYRKQTLDHYHDASRSEMQRRRTAAIQTGQGFALDCQIRSAAGDDRWMRLVVGVHHEQGRAIRIFGSKQDITGEKRMWDGLASLTRNDPLTGLASRPVFEEALGEIAHRHAGTPDRFALVLLDIDGLASVNERFGRATGEDCLRSLGMRLERLFLDAALIARVGGDEFAVLMRAPGCKVRLMSALDGAHRLLARPIPHAGGAIEIGISVGATLIEPMQGLDPCKLFAEAEAALRVAKAAGRNCVRVFDGFVAGSPARALRLDGARHGMLVV